MPPNPDKRQCTARTQAGARCRQWAINDSESPHGPPLCSTHAGRRGHRLPNEDEAAAGRRCTATTITGQRCRRWAVSRREGRQPLCFTHLMHPPSNRQSWPEEIEEQRCTATAAATGKRCRNWALRDSVTEHGPPLCHAHAGRVAETRRMPGPGERRCTAITRQGTRCRQCATRATAKKDPGAALCVIHTAHSSGDARHVRRRCTATTPDGKRCRQWALDDDGATRCWIHANPEQHGMIRHGSYRQSSFLTIQEQQAVSLAWNRGNQLQAAILIARLQILGLLAYLVETERPLVEQLNTIRLLLKGCRRVRRLVAAAREAGWTPENNRVPIAASEAIWLQNTFSKMGWEDAHGD